MRLRDLFSFLFPVQTTVSHREKILSGIGGLITIIVTVWISSHFIDPSLAPILIASMGASTVLLLGAPHSPFAQPWSFAGGHLVSALVGITCAALIPDPYLASGVAVGLAIVAMYYLRCLHPPGGATALLTVIGGAQIHSLGYLFIATPLLLNIAILLATALIFNKLIPGRRYPLALHLPGTENTPPSGTKPPVKLSFDSEDLRSALRDMDGYIDVAEEAHRLDDGRNVIECDAVVDGYLQVHKEHVAGIPHPHTLAGNYAIDFVYESSDLRWQAGGCSIQQRVHGSEPQEGAVIYHEYHHDECGDGVRHAQAGDTPLLSRQEHG